MSTNDKYQGFLSKLYQLKDNFAPDIPPRIDGQDITFFFVPGVNNIPLVLNKIESLARDIWGIEGEIKGEHLTRGPEPRQVVDSGGDDPDDYQGIYHNPEDAILEPKKLEYNQATRYYRKNWRPLLGPTLSELVRELRQRCHYKSKRDGFNTTYENLAATLGVSVSTIKRCLKRDKNGRFENEYLHHFIADIRVIKKSSGKGKIWTKGTRFLIYLSDTLTPEDKAKFT